MKKLRSIVLLLIVAALLSLVLLSFTGCGKTEEVTVETEQAEKGEKSGTNKAEPVETKYVREDCEKEYESALKVIDEVIESAKNSEDIYEYSANNSDKQGLVSLTPYYHYGDSIKHGYYDINKDGKFELIVTATVDGVDKIIEVYYINGEGKPVLLIPTTYAIWNANSVEIYTNGAIKVISDYKVDNGKQAKKILFDKISTEEIREFYASVTYYIVDGVVYDNNALTSTAVYETEEKIDEYYLAGEGTLVSLDEIDLQ